MASSPGDGGAPDSSPSAADAAPAVPEAGAPSPSHAAVNDGSDLAHMPLEALLDQRIDTATRTPTRLLQIPNRVIVVTDDEIRRRNYRYLIELVEDLPGIQVMNYVEAETGAHVVVRGIWQNNKILVLYNGHKITSPEGKDFIFGRHDWSLANVKRVEFIYGPASAIYGADAVSAVINIVPKDYGDLEGRRLEVTAGYGSYNTVEADAATGFRQGPLQVRLDAAFHHSDGPNFLHDYPDYYSSLRSPDYKAQGGAVDANGNPVWVAPSLSYHLAAFVNLGDNTRLFFQRIYSEEQSAMGFTPPLFEFSANNKWAWYQDNGGLTNELPLSPSLMLRTLVTYNHQQADPKTQFINNFFDSVTHQYTHGDYKMFRSVRFGVTEELVHTSHPWDHELKMVLGARFEDIYSLSKISITTGQPADLNYPINYQTNPAVPNGEVNFYARGAYFQAQYDLLSNLNVVAGVNVDQVWHYKTSYNPRVGLTFQPLAELALRASAAKAYLIPAPAYQFEGFNNSAFPGAGSVGAIPNTDLKPEDYLSFETGATAVLFDRHLLIDVSAFHISNDNYLLRQRILNDPQNVVYVPPIGTTKGMSITSADRIFTSENGGVVRAYGGEVAVSADRLGWIRPWANYSLVLGSQHETPTRTGTGIDTDYLANQAAHQIKGGFDLRLWPRLSIGPNLVWYSRTRIRPDAADKALVASGLDPFLLLGVSTLWDGGWYQVWARGTNLLDTHYYRPGGPVSQQAATSVPQAGFMAQGGIRLLF